MTIENHTTTAAALAEKAKTFACAYADEARTHPEKDADAYWSEFVSAINHLRDLAAAQARPAEPLRDPHAHWITSPDGLSRRNPAPNASQAMVPTSIAVTLKVGNEFAPYHPDASHIDPQYRNGWNDCYRAATIRSPAAEVQEAVAWLRPATQEVVTAERKRQWIDSEGGYRNIAERYTQPLVHPAQPSVATEGQGAVGWKLVPIKLTEEMLDAAHVGRDKWLRDQWQEAWASMLAAVPTQPSVAEVGQVPLTGDLPYSVLSEIATFFNLDYTDVMEVADNFIKEIPHGK